MRSTQETYESAQLAGVAGESMPVVVKLVHHANNGWTFHLKVDGSVTLGDGRVIRCADKTIRVKATEQIGRRRRVG